MLKRNTVFFPIHVRFEDLLDIDTITNTLKKEGAEISEFELESSKEDEDMSVIIWMKLNRENASHSAILSTVAELPCVISVQELIS